MELSWVKIDVKAEEGYKPPFFAGSMLRGALGVALKRVVCINPSYRCQGCFAADNCIYFDFYEKENSYHPYRVVSPLGMDRLEFSLYLYEESISKLPYILSSIKKALEEVGLGREKRVLKIANIKVLNKSIYEKGEFSTKVSIEPKSFEIDEFYEDVTLKFTLPLRIKSKNRLSKEVVLPILINSIHNRYMELKGKERSKLNYIVKGEIEKSSMRHLDLVRYSNRQKSRMRLGGLIGSISLKGVDKQTYAYLKLGEILGAGKQTVFGLGSYMLIPSKRKESYERD